MTVCGTLGSQSFNPLRPGGFWGPGQVLTCPDIFFSVFSYNNNDIIIIIKKKKILNKKNQFF